MPIKWNNVRLPVELHGRIVRLAKRFDHSYIRQVPGRFVMDSPAEFQDRGGTPLWYVIQKAITELEQHRKRSKYKSKTRKAIR
jgi:hypothetical protein